MSKNCRKCIVKTNSYTAHKLLKSNIHAYKTAYLKKKTKTNTKYIKCSDFLRGLYEILCCYYSLIEPDLS